MTPAVPKAQHFRGAGGADLVYREVGAGRPLVLIHGYFSTAYVNWVRYGHAASLAARGYRVLMPDLRGHGDSARSHAPADYPPDVLAHDGFALLEHLGLGSYDLAGYSLGGRTVARMLTNGAAPDRAVIAGMGLAGITAPQESNAHFRRILDGLGSWQRPSPEWQAEAFLKTVGGDPEALRLVLDTSVDTPVADLAAVQVPTLVLVGDADDRGARELAQTLPHGSYAAVPGSHMGAVTRPELGRAIGEFLAC